MMQGLYSGVSGLKAHSAGMSTVAQNLANVSTVGYKQQSTLFDDMMYQTTRAAGATTQAGDTLPVGHQVGMGVCLSSTRTLFTEGSYEQGSSFTDMAISGKGFFQVSDGENVYYTRAGNFSFDAYGTLRSADGKAVTGIPLGEDGQPSGDLAPIEIDFSAEGVTQSPPKATTSLTALMNLNVTNDSVSDPENPYFSLLNAWNGQQNPPLTATDYKQPLRVYDSEGTARDLTVYFDAAPGANGQKVVEFVVSMDPSADGRANAQGSEGAGLVMAGTMTFSSSGELTNMSAFTPGGGDLKDLNNWTAAPLVNGTPQVTLSFTGREPQTVALNLGLTAGADAWQNMPASAAGVGTVISSLPGMTSPSHGTQQTSNLPVTSSLISSKQDGYPTGELSDVQVAENGDIIATYSNGETRALYRIPIFRFTSEDGLRHEGNNLYTATAEAGNVEYGEAGTENYGSVLGGYLETSNVDMSREMTNMIITQRGFQSNSKTITTLDSMIQKALELKRN